MKYLHLCHEVHHGLCPGLDLASGAAAAQVEALRSEGRLRLTQGNLARVWAGARLQKHHHRRLVWGRLKPALTNM